MSKQNEPAFQHLSHVFCNGEPSVDTQYPGMTLRDWFAGQALTSDMCPCNGHDLTGITTWCRQIADAMLTERAKGEAPDNAAYNSALDDAVGAICKRADEIGGEYGNVLRDFAISVLNALRK